MSNSFNVTATIKSPSSGPVEMRYATGVDAINVMVAVGQLLATPIEDTEMPASIRTSLVSIRIEVAS